GRSNAFLHGRPEAHRPNFSSPRLVDPIEFDPQAIPCRYTLGHMVAAMNLRQIEAFRAVMHLGTTVQAAAFLHVSQPAVSRMIRQLEDATRLRLFKREKSRLRPTPEATALFREVERAFVGLDSLRRVAENLRDF